MTTVSIIGGTGMLGAPVAHQLLNDGFSVRILSRSPEKAQAQLGEGFSYAQADIMDVESLKVALANTDMVHINVSGHDRKSYYTQHVVGAENVLAALGNRTIDCISMISSASAYPEFNDRWDNRYKLEAEEKLKASHQPYLAFLPSWFMETLPLFQQDEKMVRIGPSTKPIHWVTAAEYAQIVSQSLQDPNCRNQRISIYGPEGIAMKEAVERYAQHHQLGVKTLPTWMAKCFGRIARDAVLVDVADLMQHYDRTGEKHVPNTIRTQITLSDWLAERPVT
ncbi:SDR family oxidoreductase [Marinibactrum halimedae]|uniref:NAD(P)-binding domain-containing protein n=1 Tax=Marinibactrum halimedae TaxID=1444977 RepID=A0AA37T2E4_9GAMM|nr:NAD(P)H-binding protein [Marinibactrum halimedae]MCD9460726.1 NAD(P)H-binding protein [Marinibactrum halimedae]GLS25148.1 hypothetical protein GCM10007877_08620 [Marinibactrum halimedae]